MPWLGRSLESVDSLDALLVVAGNLRYEQPMLAHRVRKAAVHNNAQVSVINHVSFDNNFELLSELVGSAEQLVIDLATVARAIADKTGKELSAELKGLLADCKPGKEHKAIAKSLIDADNSAVIVGVQALSSPYLGLIQELCESITGHSGATLGYLSVSANSAGACLAGATPHRTAAAQAVDAPGENAAEILANEHDVLLTLGINPSLDCAAIDQLAKRNQTMIAISSFDNDYIQQHADLVLPLASQFESSGSFVNLEGLWQSFKGCVKAQGTSRPGWKILTAIGQLLLPGDFDYSDSVAVKEELKALCRDVSLSNLCGVKSAATKLPETVTALQRVSMVPIYASDEMTRLSAALQKTPLMQEQSAIIMSRAQAKKSKLLTSEQVQIKQNGGSAVLPLRLDDGVAMGCVYIPSGIETVKDLGAPFGKVELEKVS
jgi:NADH-quinone oxidoreductase subunit G